MNCANSEQVNKSKIRIVLADDEPLVMMNLAEILTNNNFEVVGMATNGFEAIKVSGCKPDVVLMDINMPLLDGLSASKYILEQGYTKTIVITTAYNDKAFISQAAEIGIAGYLVKPITTNLLIPSIDIAHARSNDLLQLENKILEANKHVESRKIIERAKGHLMQNGNCSEKEAFEFIRQVSKDYSMSMEKISEIILLRE